MLAFLERFGTLVLVEAVKKLVGQGSSVNEIFCSVGKKMLLTIFLANIASDVLELIAEKVDHKVELKRFSPQIRTLFGN